MFRGTICINRKKQLRQNIKQESWTLSIEFLTTIINAISVITNRVICTDYVRLSLNKIIIKTTITKTSKSQANVKSGISTSVNKSNDRGKEALLWFTLMCYSSRPRFAQFILQSSHIVIFAAWLNTLLLQSGSLFKDWVKMLSAY